MLMDFKLISLPVAAAASDPFSLISMKALCTTSDTYRDSLLFKIPFKLAFELNIDDIPSCKRQERNFQINFNDLTK